MTIPEIRDEIQRLSSKLQHTKTKRWQREYEARILSLQAELGRELDRQQRRLFDEYSESTGEPTGRAVRARYDALLNAVQDLHGEKISFHEALAWLREERLRRQRGSAR